MTPSEILQNRLTHHHLIAPTQTTPGDLVARFGAMQAQDAAGARWAAGLRLATATDADIAQALADKTLIRTWSLRGTLHLIAAPDVWWLLDLVASSVLAKLAPYYRKLELDDATLTKIAAVLNEAMRNGRYLTRPELLSTLTQAGIVADNHRANFIFYWLAVQRHICLGPLHGRQETYALLAEWMPQTVTLSPDEALAELAWRYFASHGPATLADFTWWCGLPTAQAKKALELVRAGLQQETIAKQTYCWLQTTPLTTPPTPLAWLISGYDEYFLGYKDRTLTLDPAYKKQVEPGNGFSPMIVIDGKVCGTWKRTLQKEEVVIELKGFVPFTPAQEAAVALAAHRYGAFVQKHPVLNGEIGD